MYTKMKASGEDGKIKRPLLQQELKGSPSWINVQHQYTSSPMTEAHSKKVLLISEWTINPLNPNDWYSGQNPMHWISRRRIRLFRSGSHALNIWATGKSVVLMKASKKISEAIFSDQSRFYFMFSQKKCQDNVCLWQLWLFYTKKNLFLWWIKRVSQPLKLTLQDEPICNL